MTSPGRALFEGASDWCVVSLLRLPDKISGFEEGLMDSVGISAADTDGGVTADSTGTGISRAFVVDFPFSGGRLYDDPGDVSAMVAEA